MNRSMPAPHRALVALVAASAALFAPTSVALACGCFTPPVPGAIDNDQYAVNQLAEQIVFEVPGDGTITAHVLIRYNGSPDQFAWLVPVPTAPTLELSENMLFGLIDDATRPNVNTRTENVCPSPEYVCRYHGPPSDCFSGPGGLTTGSSAGGFDSNAAPTSGDGGQSPGGVTVVAQQQVGSYDTVTFAADEATAAVEWLTTNDFIVNETTTPFMQPYLDAGMLFVAAKLVPGAGTDEIKPLAMTYEWPRPIIPLRITAVAAEPHLAVTSYIYANEEYQAMDKPMVEIAADDRITVDMSGRINYPMALSRIIDEAGGDAFITEYAGLAPAGFTDPTFSGCCDEGGDWCGLETNGQCECPNAQWDAEDCSSIEGLVESVLTMETLRAEYTTLTRITTRISPEEMTFDPQFEPVGEGLGSGLSGRLSLAGYRASLQWCPDDVVDQDELTRTRLMIACATTYCGAGECVATDSGAGCRCDTGHVARTFTDLDGEASVTCIPETAMVDFGLDLELPSACADVTLADGECVDVGGFPASRCDDATASVLAPGVALPTCLPVDQTSGSPGAENFSDLLRDLAVCAPVPPDCGEWGWLEANADKVIQGEICDYSLESDQAAFQIPAEPTCEEYYGSYGSAGGGLGGSGGFTDGSDDDGCAGGTPADGLAWLAALALALAWSRRRPLLA